jgi:hypothetical protein
MHELLGYELTKLDFKVQGLAAKFSAVGDEGL